MAVFNAMINALGKAREFDRAWALIHDQMKNASEMPNFDTFVIMIRRFARAGIFLGLYIWDYRFIRALLVYLAI